MFCLCHNFEQARKSTFEYFFLVFGNEGEAHTMAYGNGGFGRRKSVNVLGRQRTGT